MQPAILKLRLQSLNFMKLNVTFFFFCNIQIRICCQNWLEAEVKLLGKSLK